MQSHILISAVLFLTLSGPAWTADHAVGSGTSLVDCDTFDGGVNPGDTLTFTGTSRSSNIEFQDCHGTGGSPIVVRNDTSQSSAFTITGQSGFVVLLDDVSFFTIDGTGGWSGSSGTCSGLTSGTWPTRGTPGTCGIAITTDSSCATGLIKIQDEITDLTIKGVEAYGGGISTCPSGIAFQLHDNDATVGIHGAVYYENWLITENYLHDTSKESMYAGSNIYGTTANARALPLRNNEFSYNLLVDNGCEAIEIKSTKSGTTSVTRNVVKTTGLSTAGPAAGCTGDGLMAFESGFIVFDSNWVQDTGGAGSGHCFNHLISNSTAAIDMATAENTYFNNVAVDCKGSGLNVRTNDSGNDPDTQALIFNNTFVSAGNDGVDTSGATGNSTIQDNILCDSAASATDTDPGDTASSNQTAACSTQDFVNLVGRDYHLNSDSAPAYNAGGVYASPPTEDHDTVARPQAVTEDDGAFEFVVAGPDPDPSPTTRRFNAAN